MLFKNEKGEWTSDFLLDGDVNMEMEEKKQNALIKTDNTGDFWKDCDEEKKEESVLDELFYIDFGLSENESILTVRLEDLREATKHTIEKFLNK